MTKHDEHAARIAEELHQAGMTNYGSSKFASHYLPTVIHAGEHIEAAVYGRYKEDGGLLGYSAGMLIATNRRVIFLDHKPGYTSMDEITYDVVSGVKHTTTGLFSTLTLHTRVADYCIRFANAKGIKKFAEYIESRFESGVRSIHVDKNLTEATIDADAIKFLKKNEIGVLSTVNRTGNVHGATIYYYVDADDRVCLVTKAATQKARDSYGHSQVALTVFDAIKTQTAQLAGNIEVVSDPTEQMAIFKKLVRPREYDGEVRLPPVTTIHEEGFVALRITPTSVKYTDYKQKAKND